MSSSKHPLYSVAIDCQKIEIRVLLNDIPILAGNQGSPLTCDIPASLQMLDGENHLEVRYGPPGAAEFLNHGSEFCVTLMRYIKGETSDSAKPIAKLDFKIPADPEKVPFSDDPGEGALDGDSLAAQPGGSIKVGKVTHTWNNETHRGAASRTIVLSAPFARWKWPQGGIISDTPETFDSLLKEYKRFWEILNAKNAPAAVPFLQDKVDAVAAAWDTDDVEARETIEIEAMLACDEIELRPMRERGLKLEIFANGRLASIVDRDGDSPIYFREKDESLDHYIPLLWHHSGNRWCACL